MRGKERKRGREGMGKKEKEEEKRRGQIED